MFDADSWKIIILAYCKRDPRRRRAAHYTAIIKHSQPPLEYGVIVNTSVGSVRRGVVLTCSSVVIDRGGCCRICTSGAAQDVLIIITGLFVSPTLFTKWLIHDCQEDSDGIVAESVEYATKQGTTPHRPANLPHRRLCAPPPTSINSTSLGEWKEELTEDARSSTGNTTSERRRICNMPQVYTVDTFQWSFFPKWTDAFQRRRGALQSPSHLRGQRRAGSSAYTKGG